MRGKVAWLETWKVSVRHWEASLTSTPLDPRTPPISFGPVVAVAVFREGPDITKLRKSSLKNIYHHYYYYTIFIKPLGEKSCVAQGVGNLKEK